MKTKRRNFLQMLSVSPLAFLLPKAAEASQSVPSAVFEERALCYRGFVIRWTGWKMFHDSTRLVGQWLAQGAVHGDAVNLYSSTPGRSGRYAKGQAFDLTCVYPQEFLVAETSFTALERAKSEAYKIILREIDSVLGGDQ